VSTVLSRPPSPVLAPPAETLPAPGRILVSPGGEVAERLARLARARGEPLEHVAADMLRCGLEHEARRRQAEAGLAGLTPRQRQIARLAAGGRTNRQIARELWLSPETVKTHLRRALEHFDVHSKAELRLLLFDLESEWPSPSSSSSAAPSNPGSASTTTD
jgi:DNA-binding CsgD family transcriptional regulator